MGYVQMKMQLGKILGLYIFYNEYREIRNEISTVG